MALEKMLNARFALKIDTYANWTSETLGEGKGALCVLKHGEIGFCEIPSGNTEATTAPTILFKVGDGTSPFKSLKWGSALAADVYGWAKAETVSLEGQKLVFKNKDKSVAHEVDLGGFVTDAELGTILAGYKTVQTEKEFNGSTVKTVTKVTQNANGEVEVTYDNIALPAATVVGVEDAAVANQFVDYVKLEGGKVKAVHRAITDADIKDAIAEIKDGNIKLVNVESYESRSIELKNVAANGIVIVNNGSNLANNMTVDAGQIVINDGYGRQKIILGDDNDRTRVLEATATDNTGGSVKIELGESGNTTISGGKVTASEFVGNLTGNAATATKATQDGSGNIITATYATKEELTNHGNTADGKYATKEELTSHANTADGKYATKEALQSEVNRATGIEGGLRSDVDAVVARVNAFLDNTGAATDAIDTLQDLLTYIETHDDVEISGILADIQALETKLTLGTYENVQGDEVQYDTVKDYVQALYLELSNGITGAFMEIGLEKNAREDADKALDERIDTEAETRENADKTLGERIDAIVAPTTGILDVAKKYTDDEIAELALGTMSKEAATDYIKKTDAPGYADILTKTAAQGIYRTETQVNGQIDNKITALDLPNTYQPKGNYASADQGAKADSAVQSVTSVANNGIKATRTGNDVVLDWDTDVVFVFNAGSSTTVI